MDEASPLVESVDAGEREILNRYNSSSHALRRFGDADRVLGSGTFGVVVRVTNDAGVSRAVKLLSNQGKRVPTFDFIKELGAMTKMYGRTPYALSIDGWSTDEQYGYFLMPLAQGDLASQIGNASETDLLRWLYESTLGVHILHQNNILHNDIKPQNVLLIDGDATVSDYGLSYDHYCIMGDRRSGGTPGYWAPEISKGGAASPASDVWSLGAMYARILLRELRIGLYNDDGVLNYTAFEPLQRNEEMLRLIISMMQTNPRSRPSTFDILQSRVWDGVRPASSIPDLAPLSCDVKVGSTAIIANQWRLNGGKRYIYLSQVISSLVNDYSVEMIASVILFVDAYLAVSDVSDDATIGNLYVASQYIAECYYSGNRVEFRYSDDVAFYVHQILSATGGRLFITQIWHVMSSQFPSIDKRALLRIWISIVLSDLDIGVRGPEILNMIHGILDQSITAENNVVTLMRNRLSERVRQSDVTSRLLQRFDVVVN